MVVPVSPGNSVTVVECGRASCRAKAINMDLLQRQAHAMQHFQYHADHARRSSHVSIAACDRPRAVLHSIDYIAFYYMDTMRQCERADALLCGQHDMQIRMILSPADQSANGIAVMYAPCLSRPRTGRC